MNYIKCPRCDLNYINLGEEDICIVCFDEMNINKKKKTVILSDDYSTLVQGRTYKGSSRTIYEKFGNSLGWDKSQSDKFGWQQIMYAVKADKEKKNDIWFIFHANYSKDNIESVVESGKYLNLIENNGEIINEIVENYIPKAEERNRVVFANNGKGYEFLGIYKTEPTTYGKKHIRILNSY